MSYAVRAYDTVAVAESLRAGEELAVIDDDTNEVNPAALLLATHDGAAVGWVPDLLIDYVRQVRARGGTLRVLQNNGPDAPWHTRLLARVSGNVPPDTAVFSGVAGQPSGDESPTLGASALGCGR